jgi:formate hydrogenlyase subunit 3/multisubunit Na+/H+ antiporter MnhD subunit
MPLLNLVIVLIAVGFLLWLIPTITIIFGAGFLDRYSWLRSSPQLASTLQFVGILMIVTGGLWAATQRHLGRIMAYSSIAETGFSILALSLDPRLGIPILFLLIPARALGLAVWSLSLTVIKDHSETLRFGAVRGLLRSVPFASAGLVLASLSTSAFPLLAGFPARLALWDGLSRVSLSGALWLGIGTIGLLISSFRSPAPSVPWKLTRNFRRARRFGHGAVSYGKASARVVQSRPRERQVESMVKEASKFASGK